MRYSVFGSVNLLPLTKDWMVLYCFSFCTHFLLASWSSAASPVEILEHLRTSQQQVSNATFECIWTTEMEAVKGPDGVSFGGGKEWEKQVMYWDSFGRRRCIIEHGPISGDGELIESENPFVEDFLFNGEIVVNAKFYPLQDRTGKVVGPGKTSGYNSVIIGDASSPLRTTLESLRNPLEYIGNVALREIEAAISQKSIDVISETDDSVIVSILHDEVSAPYAKSVITVSPKMNWAIRSVQSFNSDGELAREIDCDYNRQADGLWVPMRGKHTHWGDRGSDGKPYFVWKFEVMKAALNNPDFNDHLFDVKVNPDAAVSDTRYKVAYRVGEEEAVAEDLASYAANARKAVAKSTRALGASSLDKSASLTRQIIFGVNALVIVICVTLLVLRHFRQRSNTL